MARKTVYASTLMAILALAGGWTLATGTTAVQGPSQQSSVTVTAPAAFSTATVESTQMLTVSSALVSGLTGVAGTQGGSGNGLGSGSSAANALLAACTELFCAANYSAVDPTHALLVGDSALQVQLTVSQPLAGSAAIGFDVQVEIVYAVASAPSTDLYAFGTGYFDTGTNSLANGVTPGATVYAVGLYVDLATSALNLASISDIAITMNGCLTATGCP